MRWCCLKRMAERAVGVKHSSELAGGTPHPLSLPMAFSDTTIAVALTVASSAASAIGKAKQKAATRGLPALGGGAGGSGPSGSGRSVLREYLRCPAWVGGLALDVLGGLFIMVAYSMAPVRGVAGGGRRRGSAIARRRGLSASTRKTHHALSLSRPNLPHAIPRSPSSSPSPA